MAKHNLHLIRIIDKFLIIMNLNEFCPIRQIRVILIANSIVCRQETKYPPNGKLLFRHDKTRLMIITIIGRIEHPPLAEQNTKMLKHTEILQYQTHY